VTGDEVRALGSLCACLDVSRVRIHRGEGTARGRWLRRLVLTLSGGRGVALGNHVFLPERGASLPVLAHELTHCAQYQAWGPLRYYARALAERAREVRWRLGLGPSPYDYASQPPRPFESYRMEQQGQIVEDCFRGCARAAALSPYRPSSGVSSRAEPDRDRR
jgi:hypothetical protein